MIAGFLVLFALSAWAVAAWALFSRELMRETALSAVAAAYKREKNATRRLEVYEQDQHDHLWRLRYHLREAVAAEFASRIDKALAVVCDLPLRVFPVRDGDAEMATGAEAQTIIEASFDVQTFSVFSRNQQPPGLSRRKNIADELGFRLGQAYSNRIMALLEELEKAPNRAPGATYLDSRS